jgi:PleD family two-component response regulator
VRVPTTLPGGAPGSPRPTSGSVQACWRALSGIVRPVPLDSLVERRALVVEDDEDTRSLFEFTLSTQGFDVRSVDFGFAALDAIASFDPDLVTLDLGLPGIDGIETWRRLRPR